jgi:hypothetical protein
MLLRRSCFWGWWLRNGECIYKKKKSPEKYVIDRFMDTLRSPHIIHSVFFSLACIGVQS